MKFHNGCWLVKEEYTCFTPSQIYEVNVTQKKVKLFMPIKKIITKGDTLDGMGLTMEITAPSADSFSVKLYHYKGIKQKKAKFELNTNKQNLN